MIFSFHLCRDWFKVQISGGRWAAGFGRLWWLFTWWHCDQDEDEQTYYDDNNDDDDDGNGDEGNVKVGGAPCSGGEAVEAPSQQWGWRRGLTHTCIIIFIITIIIIIITVIIVMICCIIVIMSPPPPLVGISNWLFPPKFWGLILRREQLWSTTANKHHLCQHYHLSTFVNIIIIMVAIVIIPNPWVNNDSQIRGRAWE